MMPSTYNFKKRIIKDREEYRNLIYKINCENRNGSFVDEIRRLFKVIIYKYKND